MRRRVLIAGVGNLFFGDDGFGVEVAQRLATAAWPEGVRVLDIGIRGIHLAFDLLDAPDLLILVDATARGAAPGTLFVIEPDLDADCPPDAHSLSIPAVFAQLRALGGAPPRTRLVGCEPEDTSERIGLSPVVERALEQASTLVRELVDAEFSSTGTGGRA